MTPPATSVEIRCPGCGIFIIEVGRPGPETFARGRCRKCRKSVRATWAQDKLTIERVAASS